MKVLLVTALVVAATASDSYFRLPQPYAYRCNEQQLCQRVARNERSEGRTFYSRESCQLTCARSGSLWPRPTGRTSISQDTVTFHPTNLRVTKQSTTSSRVSRMLDQAIEHFTRNMHFMHPDYPEAQKQAVTEEQYQSRRSSDRQQQQYNDFEQYGQQYDRYDQQFDRFEQQYDQFEQQYNQRRRSDINQQQRQDFRQDNRNQNRQLREQRQRYLRYSPFARERSSPGVDRRNVNLEVTITKDDHQMRLDTDESYNLVIQTVGDDTTITILATTYFGARHALETLSQLIAYDDTNDSLQIVSSATVDDEPKFKYRGFMLDTGRNFYPKEDLMRLMDAMSYNKMNYFHWHISDAASFPMYSNRRPEMAYYGAYSPRQVYYPEDIKDIVEYANVRGIAVIPELDGPAHANAGWEWGEKENKGKFVLCTDNSEPWFALSKEPPSGQLNPVNPELYNVMGEIYSDFMDYFNPEMIHMGGDDVSFKCWQNAPEVQQYLSAQGKEANSREYFELWNSYQKNAYTKMQEAAQGRKVTPIIHSSSFARNYVDKNNYIIQINENANESAIADYVSNGFRVIFSNQDQWNLNCLSNTWMGDKARNCPQEVPSWEQFYRNSPLDMLNNLGMSNARSEINPSQQQTGGETPRDLVLGGEATLWSYDTDYNGFQAKVWPRLSAFAERLWSDPSQINEVEEMDAQRRLNVQRQRMVYRGIQADPIQPEYCMHDESVCFSETQFRARSSLNPQQ